MYLAGRPSTEYSFLREFLKSDPNHELVSFVILRNPENPSPASDRELSLIPFPMDEIFSRTLPQFDLFILENFSASSSLAERSSSRAGRTPSPPAATRARLWSPPCPWSFRQAAPISSPDSL